MLDVAHYFMEEDLISYSVEHARFRRSIRHALYEQMYGVDYAYAPGFEDEDEYPSSGEGIDMSDPTSPTVTLRSKPYIPPTNQTDDMSNPFPGLEPPVG